MNFSLFYLSIRFIGFVKVVCNCIPTRNSNLTSPAAKLSIQFYLCYVTFNPRFFFSKSRLNLQYNIFFVHRLIGLERKNLSQVFEIFSGICSCTTQTSILRPAKQLHFGENFFAGNFQSRDLFLKNWFLGAESNNTFSLQYR